MGSFLWNQGYPYQSTFSVTRASLSSLTRASQLVYLSERGAERLPDVKLLDLRISRAFRLGGSMRLIPQLEGFNLANSGARACTVACSRGAFANGGAAVHNPPMLRNERAWSDALAAHRDAVARFADAVRAVDESRWTQPSAEGKWSPAEVAEHVGLSYAKFREELSGGQGIRVRLKGWRLLFTRLYYLRRILRTGELPTGAPAVREIRPAGSLPAREDAVSQIEALARACAEHLERVKSTRSAGVTHPYFGKLTPWQSLRIAAIHTEHHRRQLPGTASAPMA